MHSTASLDLTKSYFSSPRFKLAPMQTIVVQMVTNMLLVFLNKKEVSYLTKYLFQINLFRFSLLLSM